MLTEEHYLIKSARQLTRPTARSQELCLACWSNEVDSIPTLTSSFLSERAWGGKPERTSLIRCRNCNFRYFERGLSDTEAARYYSDYREESYLKDRSQHEWFYTKRLHKNLSHWMHSSERARQLTVQLADCGYSRFDRVLDYGGSTGYLISQLNARNKSVFDLSGCAPLPDIEMHSDPSSLPRNAFDLIVCAQTLEHCSDPLADMTRIEGALAPGGLLYLELPNEIWRGNFRPTSWQHQILEWEISSAIESSFLLKILDFIFTGIRTKLRVLPAIGFVPMREHLNYFSLKSLECLAANFSLTVIAKAVIASNSDCPYILARKDGSSEITMDVRY